MNPKRFYGTGIPNVKPDSLTGTLIVLEGADGSGRSTQIEMLRDWLQRQGYATMEVGLKRSELVGEELELAMQGNTMGPLTFSLFYATDFADQLEHIIIPALRSGFIVLADRYIYTLMARAVVRGVDADLIRDVYGVALVPDVVFHLDVSPKVLAERTFRKYSYLDFWESGMDIQRSGDMYECFIRYQHRIGKIFDSMQEIYHFIHINGDRTPGVISRDLRAKIEPILAPPKTVAPSPTLGTSAMSANL